VFIAGAYNVKWAINSGSFVWKNLGSFGKLLILS